jgi:mannose-6-phosphate isomerase
MRGISPNLLDLDRFDVDVKRVDKPWGYEILYALTDRYCGKVIFIKGGEELSLQFHREKDETIYVQSGRVEFQIGDPGKPVDTEVVGLEVSTPELDDIVRLEDRYGRADRPA